MLFLAFAFSDDIDLGNEFYDKKDYKEAFKYYKKACDKGQRAGCNNLASLYDEGKGVKKTLKKLRNYMLESVIQVLPRAATI